MQITFQSIECELVLEPGEVRANAIFEIEPVKGGKLTLGRASLRRELIASTAILLLARLYVNEGTDL